MARSKRSRAAKKRSVYQNQSAQASVPPELSQPSVPPPEPSQLSIPPAEPLQWPVSPPELSQQPILPSEPSQRPIPAPEPLQLALPPPQHSQLPIHPAEPSQVPVPPLAPSQLSVHCTKHSQPSIRKQGLPSQSAVEQLRSYQQNVYYSFTATHSDLLQPTDSIQDNALTLTPNDVEGLVQCLPRNNAWKDEWEGNQDFLAFQKFERGATLQNVEAVSDF
jgi:hypothetical protein